MDAAELEAAQQIIDRLRVLGREGSHRLVQVGGAAAEEGGALLRLGERVRGRKAPQQADDVQRLWQRERLREAKEEAVAQLAE